MLVTILGIMIAAPVLIIAPILIGLYLTIYGMK